MARSARSAKCFCRCMRASLTNGSYRETSSITPMIFPLSR